MINSHASVRAGLCRFPAFRLASLAILAGLSACGGGDSGIVTRVPQCTITGVVVQPGTTTLSVGETTPLQALPSSQNCTSVPAASWSSGSPAVATVNATSGQVTAVTAGTAVITATIGSASGSSVVTVRTPPVASIVVTPSSPSPLQIGQSVTLTAEPRDQQGRALTGRVVTWQSNATNIATVDVNTGRVTAVAPGSAAITASSEGISQPVTITVSPRPPASVVLTVPTVTLVVPQTAQATAVVRDAQGTAMPGETVSWTSSNNTVATVTNTGLITAVAAGQARIRATSTTNASLADSVAITVSTGSTTVTISLAATLNLADFVTATAVVRDGAQNVIPNANVTWTSSNPTVASVISTTGVVTALAAGTTNITASVVGTPSASATRLLTVVAPVRTVTLAQSNVLLEPGPNAGLTSQQLNVTLRDALGNALTGRVITYTSSNTNVATVNSTGLVSAVGVGTGNITVTSEGVSTQVPLIVARAFAVIEAHQPTNTNTYQPIQINSAGSPITVTRTGTGQYRVSIAGIGTGASTIGRNFTALVSGANASINSQLGAPTAMCNMSGLDPAGPTIITVLCSDPSTLALKDAPFRAILIGDNSVGGTGTGAAFSAHNTFTGPTYNAPPTFAWNTAGTALTVTPAFGAPEWNSTQARHSMGVTFPGQYALASTISATAGVSCEVQSQVPSTQVTDVVCFDRTGAVNALHTVVKLSSGRPGQNGGLAFVDAGNGVNTGQGFNSAGGTVVTSRTGVGKYTVVFGGMVATGALGVMVSPWGASGWTACSHHVVSTNPVTIDVACYNAFGAFMNAGSAFTLLVLQ